MTEQELGTKRLCAHCGAKFFDLHHSPITCPKCGTVFEIAPLSSRFGSERAPVAAPEPKLEMAETDNAQFVSLGEAEAAEEEEDSLEPDDGLIEESRKMGPKSPTSSKMTGIKSRQVEAL